jgi:hypothetical protein
MLQMLRSVKILGKGAAQSLNAVGYFTSNRSQKRILKIIIKTSDKHSGLA